MLDSVRRDFLYKKLETLRESRTVDSVFIFKNLLDGIFVDVSLIVW
jgi:hypothetical protein